MTNLSLPQEPSHVVAIIGGAVAGSEAAAFCAERGILALVIEQNDRPFGKIEDGLPRWHQKLRDKEYAQIGENLRKPFVLFLPRTLLGRDLSLEALLRDWGVSSVLMASGAWRDRPLFAGAEQWLGKGLVNQNPFVYWYNHYPDEGFKGPHYDIVDDAIVIGGGLASIDVVKIINLELYKRALRERGIHVTTVELEHAGIPQTLTKHGLSQADLGVRGVTLYYRREKSAMPLASAPEDATPQQLEKVGQVRAKVMDKVIEKYLVRFEPNHAPTTPIIEEGRMVGLTFQRTQTVDGKLINIAGATVDVRSPLIVSSVGSIPLPIPEVPMKGELIDFESWETGRVRNFENVFGLGNVLTGKGNIKESRKSSSQVTNRLIADYLGLTNQEPSLESIHDNAREAAREAVAATEKRPKLTAKQIAVIGERVREQWSRAGYDGDYDAWIAKVTPKSIET
jgi:hypothetical protein